MKEGKKMRQVLRVWITGLVFKFFSLSFLSILNPGSDEFLISKVSNFRKSLHSIISFVKKEREESERGEREGEEERTKRKSKPNNFSIWRNKWNGENLPEFGVAVLSTTCQSSLTLCHLWYGHFVSLSLPVDHKKKQIHWRKKRWWDEEGEMDLCDARWWSDEECVWALYWLYWLDYWRRESREKRKLDLFELSAKANNECEWKSSFPSPLPPRLLEHQVWSWFYYLNLKGKKMPSILFSLPPSLSRQDLNIYSLSSSTLFSSTVFFNCFLQAEKEVEKKVTTVSVTFSIIPLSECLNCYK